MSVSTLVSEVEGYLESHVAAVKDLVELVPRLEQLVGDVEKLVAGQSQTGQAKPVEPAAATSEAAAPEPMPWAGATPAPAESAAETPAPAAEPAPASVLGAPAAEAMPWAPGS